MQHNVGKCSSDLCDIVSEQEPLDFLFCWNFVSKSTNKHTALRHYISNRSCLVGFCVLAHVLFTNVFFTTDLDLFNGLIAVNRTSFSGFCAKTMSLEWSLNFNAFRSP